MSDMRVTIEKKTDQLNFEDFLGGVTRTVTISEVRKGSKEQQYDLVLDGDHRVWRPAVTVLKLLVQAWGDNAKEWAGRRATLYGDPTVTFGRDVVGGIRVSHLSHISEPVVANLTVTRGKRAKHTVEPLVESTPTPTTDDLPTRKSKAVAWFAAKGVVQSALEAHVGKGIDEWGDGDLESLTAARDALVAEAAS